MKKGSRRVLSRLLAGVMLISSMFSSTAYVSAADEAAVVAYADETTTGGSLDVVTSPAASGKSYVAQFAGADTANGTPIDGTAYGSGTILLKGAGYFHGSAHGLALKNGDQIEINVAGNADVIFGLCQYGSGTEYAITDAAGNSVGSIAAKGTTDGEEVKFSYKGDATVLTFTLSCGGEAYLHSIKVNNEALPIGEASNFVLFLDDISYDTEGVDEAGAPIVVKTVDQQELTGNVALNTGESIDLADSKLKLVGNMDGTELKKFTPEREAAQNISRGGRDGVNGYKAGPRHAQCNDLPEVPDFGDGTAIVFTPAATGTFNTYFDSTSFLRVWDFDLATGERYGYVDSDVSIESYAFKAIPGHTYVLSTTGKTNNMTYVGFEYIIDNPIDVTLTTNNVDAVESSLASLEISLTDVALPDEKPVVIGAGSNTVTLAGGHTYKLSTNDGGVKALVNGSETFKAEADTPVTIDLYDIPDVQITGTITGTPAGTVTKLSFTNQINGQVIDATVNADMTYTVTLKPGDYNTSVETTNGGVTYDHAKATTGENINEVYVEVPVDDGSKSYDLPTEIAAATSDITFVSADPAAPIRGNNATSIRASKGDSLIVPVNGVQKVTVAGWYAGSWDINGQNAVTTDSSVGASSPTTTSYITDGTETSVTVNVLGDGANYLYWIKVENTIPFTKEINVPQDYPTLNEANEAIANMVGRPEGEEGRVTINLNVDLEEQVVFDAPYITLNGNGHEISWYYGVGTNYYSIDKSTGLYSERLFRDKYSYAEGDGHLWGGVVIVRGDNFTAVNTTFKNNYNYKLTEKAFADIHSTVGSIPAKPTIDTDVTAYAHKERSNAFYVEAKNIELYKCNILASQDTFGRNSSTNNGYSVYLKDCVIGGNTDYICGEFTAVFDNCELQWKTFKDDATNNGKVGYIVAPKTSPYIFRNCTITCDGNAPASQVKGLYGRTWGSGSNCTFINTETNGMINETGWGEMSTGDSVSAIFCEYGNTNKGEAFATTGGAVEPKALTDEEAAALIDYDTTIATLGWTPEYYEYIERFDGIWGDADDNGVLTAKDASTVLVCALSGSDMGLDLRGCDVNGDGILTADDASMILQKVLDGSFAFPAEPTTEGTTEALPIDPAANYVPSESKENVLALDVAYNGTNAMVTAMQRMNYKEDAGSVGTFGDVTYPGYAASTSVNTAMTIDGAAKTGYRVAYKIEAKVDTPLAIDAKINVGKGVYVVISDEDLKENGVYTSVASYANEGTEDLFYTLNLELKAGQVAYVVGSGTNFPIYALKFADPSPNYVPSESKENVLALDVAYNGTNALVTAMQRMNYKEDAGSVGTFGDVTYPGYAASTSVNTAMTIDGATKTGYRIAYKIEARVDTPLAIDAKINVGKGVYVIISDEDLKENGTYTSVASFANEGTEDLFYTLNLELKAGQVAYVVGSGTNLPIYALNFTKASSSEETTEITTGAPVDIYVVGDSTGCHYAETADTNYYYKRVGFGDKLADYLVPNATVTNLALSGRSSKSFTTEANYETLKSSLKAGDILLIAFGHNDEKSDDAARYTTPGGVWDAATGTYTEGSFKASLYENYVKLAKEAGATPILCSPIVRRTDSGTWSANQLHQANGGDYAADVKALAEEQGVDFIDLTNITKAKYDEMTPANTVNMHAWTNSKATSVDNTHLNNYGAKMVAYLIATNASTGLASYVAANPVEPTVADAIVNPDYVESSADDLTGDELNSILWTTTSPWYGTVFGDIGGQGKLNGYAADGITLDPATLADNNGDGTPNFLVQENTDGSVRIKAGTPNADDTPFESFGKIAGTSDGLAMYYQPVDVGVNFSISAKAHVKNVARNNNQTAFGAIVADKVLVDENNKITIDNYVAASPLKMTATVGTNDATTGELITAWAGYARIAGTLTSGEAQLSSQDELPKGGDVIDVKITKVGNVYTVEYGGKTSTFTVDMTGTVYVGLFAARCADVTFTDIVYNNEVAE